MTACVPTPLNENTADVAYSTYLGGTAADQARDVAVDKAGNAYVAGGTLSRDFPTTSEAVQPTLNLNRADDPSIEPWDVFVTKLRPDGALAWSTLIGGPNHDRAYAIEVDDAGFVYVGGRAGRGFPVTAGAFQTTFQGGQEAAFYGGQDGFVCKLKADSGSIVFCSYFGTSDYSIVRDLAVDGRGAIYLASGYGSGEYPDGVRERVIGQPHAGSRDEVLAKINSDGRIVLWVAFLGGSRDETNTGSVRLDGDGNPCILLTTSSDDIQTTSGAFDRTYGGNEDVYVAKLHPETGKLVWGTYLGGGGNESTETHEFAVDRQGYAYIAAPTDSRDFPTTPGVFQRSYGGGANDMFVAKLSPDGARLVASTLIGGRRNDRPEGVAVDDQGRVHLTGTTTSDDFPVTAGAWLTRLRGDRDAVAVKLAPDFGQLLYSTFIGSIGSDEFGRGAAVDAAGNFYVVGQTPRDRWPLVNPWQARYGGKGDAFAVKLRLQR